MLWLDTNDTQKVSNAENYSIANADNQIAQVSALEYSKCYDT